jgi:3-phosphoinositide dependent protein kinase-1
MEFPPNGELWEKAKIFGIIPNSVYKYFMSHIVKAVSILHNKYNIVHRDLKPENILLDENYRIKLIDFGTAKDLDRPDLKGAGNGLKGKKQFDHYVGTAHYMAPECIHNKASEKKSDIYSLSGVFYFLKVGSPPFQGGSEYLTFNKTLYTNLLTCPELFEPELQDLVKKMNSKEM